MTNSCLDNFESILGSSWYILSPDSPQSSGSISPLLFWAFINETLFLGYLAIITATIHSTWALARFGSYFFKEGAPLALGPTFGPLVEFWIQLSYFLKFSPCSNQSHMQHVA